MLESEPDANPLAQGMIVMTLHQAENLATD